MSYCCANLTPTAALGWTLPEATVSRLNNDDIRESQDVVSEMPVDMPTSLTNSDTILTWGRTGMAAVDRPRPLGC